MLLSLGIVTSVVAQALFNMSVVLSLVPTKGIPLPFISYGGSSLVPTLAAVGILLNVSQHASGTIADFRLPSVDFGKRTPELNRQSAIGN
jgi:cell division protein FtsW (lipid II flippase)